MLEIILEPVLGFAAYWTGKPVVRLLSLGYLHASLRAEMSLDDHDDRKESKDQSITFVRDGKRYLSADAVIFVGIMTWILVIVALWLLSR